MRILNRCWCEQISRQDQMCDIGLERLEKKSRGKQISKVKLK